MKKKLISVLLSAALVCSVLAGCGKSDSNSGSSAAADESGAADAGSDGAAAQDTAPAEAEADTGSKDGEYDLTLYTINSTDEDFNDLQRLRIPTQDSRKSQPFSPLAMPAWIFWKSMTR